jgi:hypothetical protein
MFIDIWYSRINNSQLISGVIEAVVEGSHRQNEAANWYRIGAASQDVII